MVASRQVFRSAQYSYLILYFHSIISRMGMGRPAGDVYYANSTGKQLVIETLAESIIIRLTVYLNCSSPRLSFLPNTTNIFRNGRRLRPEHISNYI